MTPVSTGARKNDKRKTALLNVAIVLAFLWVFGLVASFTLGGWIHLLLAGAVGVYVFSVIRTANHRGNP